MHIFFEFCVLSFSCFSVSRVFCLICFIHTSKTFSVLSFPYFSVHICCLFSQTSLSIFRLIEPDNLSSFEWNQNNNALRNILNSFFNNRKTEKYKKSPCHIYKRSSNRLFGIVDPSPTQSPNSEKTFKRGTRYPNRRKKRPFIHNTLIHISSFDKSKILRK